MARQDSKIPQINNNLLTLGSTENTLQIPSLVGNFEQNYTQPNFFQRASYLAGNSIQNAWNSIKENPYTVANIGVNAIGDLLAQGNQSSVGNTLSGISDAIPGITPVGKILKPITAGVGKLFNAAFGSNLNQEEINSLNTELSNVGSDLSNANNYDSLAQAQSNIGDINVKGADLGTQGWFNRDVDNAREELQKRQNDLSNIAMNSAMNISTKQNLQNMRHLSADGGIFIKPENRGKFTAAAKSRGMGVQEFASKVLANKEDYSPLMVKRANFARNASHWGADGGLLSNEFPTGINFIGNGGSHSENPNGGVQMGIAPDGLPNLVEEGEAIYNNYVFSNRLRVPKAIRQKYKLRGNTFAQVFNNYQKEFEETPNDDINKRGVDYMAQILIDAQEEIKAAKNAKKRSTSFANGGHMLALGDDELNKIGTSLTPEEQIEIGNIVANSFGPYRYDKEGINAFINALNPSQDDLENVYNKTLPARVAPILANTASVISDALGNTNTTTYFNEIKKPANISPNYVGTWLGYNPLDVNYALNQIQAQANANRNAIMQSNSPARNAALAAADYAAQKGISDAYRSAVESNLNQRAQQAQFNRGTEGTNAQMALQADAQNASLASRYYDDMLRQAQMIDASSGTATQGRWSNIGNLAQSIANLGRERYDTARTDALINSDVWGTMNEYMRQLLPSTRNAANGGKIKTKKKKGLTY